jgi:hypothetical protein
MGEVSDNHFPRLNMKASAAEDGDQCERVGAVDW